MRKELYRMAAAEATRLFARAPVVHVASTTAEGRPLLRTVHGVVVDGCVAFHGAPAGEKTEAVGREAVVVAEEVVAPIPSYFVDPERACPATTYYLSAHAHGRLEEVDDPETKAAVLRALMEKYQPEGGHVAIDASHALYRKAIAGIMVLRVSLAEVLGKAKLGQNRTPAELARVLEQLWQRGLPGDPFAIERVRAANPGARTPPFLTAPAGTVLVCALGEEDAPAAARLLAEEGRPVEAPPGATARALLSSAAWVGARASGSLIATAHAVSDGELSAFVSAACVARPYRDTGIGAAVMRLLLDHPAVRRVRDVRYGRTRSFERVLRAAFET